MNNIKKLIVASTLMFASIAISPLAFAAKVVVLDLQQAILLTDLAKHRQQELAGSAEFNSLRAEAESLQEELKALEKKASTEGLTWSPEEQAEHAKKGELIQRDLQHVMQKAQVSQQAMMQSIVQAVKEEYISEALTNIVKAEGIELVLRKEVSNFSTPESDITLKLANELNKRLAAEKK